MEDSKMVTWLSHRRSFLNLVVPGLALLFCPPSVSAEGFTAIELPPVETRMGAFAAIDPTGIDRRGRVVGGASLVEEESPGVYGYWVGFRFDPKTGVSSAIDPLGGLHADLWSINDRGVAFGTAEGRNFNQLRLFLYGVKGGFDFLESGSSKLIRRAFWLYSLTNKGNLAGTVSGVPHLYLRGQGWIDIRKRHEAPVPDNPENILVNDVGDYAIQDYQYTYVSLGGGDLERIGPDDFDVYLEALGNRHQVIGSYKRQSKHKWDIGGPNRPYVYSSKDGFIDILPDGARHGVARWIRQDGAIYGTATRVRGGDTLFRRVRTRGVIYEAAARSSAGDRLTRRNDDDFAIGTVDLRKAFNEGPGEYTFRSAEVVDVDNFGRLVAEVKVRPRNIETCWGFRGKKFFVYFDEEQGFVDLQEAVDEAGLDLLIFEIVDMNDRGHIIARACRRGASDAGLPWTGVLLRPRED